MLLLKICKKKIINMHSYSYRIIVILFNVTYKDIEDVYCLIGYVLIIMYFCNLHVFCLNFNLSESLCVNS